MAGLRDMDPQRRGAAAAELLRLRSAMERWTEVGDRLAEIERRYDLSVEGDVQAVDGEAGIRERLGHYGSIIESLRTDGFEDVRRAFDEISAEVAGAEHLATTTLGDMVT